MINYNKVIGIGASGLLVGSLGACASGEQSIPSNINNGHIEMVNGNRDDLGLDESYPYLDPEQYSNMPQWTYRYMTKDSDEANFQCMGIRTYEIKRGDTLIKIAKEAIGHYWSYIDQEVPNSEAKAYMIAQMNDIIDPSSIEAGDTIVLPNICDTSRNGMTIFD